ncbi:hypothetical protein FGO68_gene2059 [Halteria grandinella]|uniref:Uncharacterized protein n=1 Tax=Halteria grandinella TaxID=5974 RepID=A0A8J8NQB8_HALGN|nr:hypothetical protein FGO68_gene2059 [Halteria grandinella]
MLIYKSLSSIIFSSNSFSEAKCANIGRKKILQFDISVLQYLAQVTFLRMNNYKQSPYTQSLISIIMLITRSTQCKANSGQNYNNFCTRRDLN